MPAFLDHRQEAAFAASFLAHLLLFALLFALQGMPVQWSPVEVLIVENPASPLNTQKKQTVMVPTKTSQTAKKAVPTTGVSRNSTVNEANTAAKIGNTLSKAPDTLPSTDDGLPQATEEFLVNKWPSLQNDVRTVYPREAKQRGIEGSVVMDLYVDSAGQVKKAQLVRGPGYGLNEAALEAARQFIFSPAKVGDKPVPVIIRYSYKFVIQK